MVINSSEKVQYFTFSNKKLIYCDKDINYLRNLVYNHRFICPNDTIILEYTTVKEDIPADIRTQSKANPKIHIHSIAEE